MRLKKRQEYLEDFLLDGEDIKRLKKATEALKKRGCYLPRGN